MASAMKRASTHSPRSLKFLKNLNSSIWLLWACGVRRGLRPKEKARPGGPRLVFRSFTLYFQYSILKWGKASHFLELYFQCYERVSANRVVFALLTRFQGG